MFPLDNRFLLYTFQEHDLQSQITALDSGATVEHMRVPDAEKLTLRLPPLSTQHTIASILPADDDLIENNMRRIALLEEMAQLLYQEWFVKFRFPEHEEARMRETEMGMMPEGWEMTTIGAQEGAAKAQLLIEEAYQQGKERRLQDCLHK